TLMYFTPELQERVLASFNFALKENGVLFLGKSEVLVSRSALFAPLDLKRRVFRKRSSVIEEPMVPVLPLHDDEDETVTAQAKRAQDVVFEVTPIAQMVVDRDGSLALANRQARVLFGLRQADVGRQFKDLEVSYRPVELRSLIDQALAKRRDIEAGETE